MPKVVFHNADRKLKLTAHKSLKNFIPEIFKLENKVLHRLDYIFCSDAYLLQINQAYLQHDDYTDIITFDLSEHGNSIMGEIYISLDRVKENADTLQVAYEKECLRVLFHGALHLCGYKDKSLPQQKQMRSKEDAYIEMYLLRE